MKTTKRILSMLLLCAMLLGLLPAGVLATESTVQASADQGETLEQWANRLDDEIAKLPNGGDWNGKIDLTGFIVKPNTQDMLGFRGPFYLLTYYNGEAYLWDGGDTTVSGGVVSSSKVTMSADGFSIASGANDSKHINLLPYGVKGTNGRPRYRMQQNNLNGVAADTSINGIAPVTLETGTTEANLYMFHENSHDYFVIRRSITNEEHGIIYNGTGFQWGRAVTTAELNSLTKFYLYRAWSTKELRDAIAEVAHLLDSPSTYTEQTVYRDFLTCLETSIDLFSKYNRNATALMNAYDYFWDELDRQCNALRSYITLLTSTTKYIDIPVEILDFRADNILFQNMGLFSFRNNIDGLPELPGKLRDENRTDSYNVRTGLTLQELVGGKLIYHEDTVAYVANALHQKSIGSMHEIAVGFNRSLNSFVSNKIYGKKLGSWEDVKNSDGSITPGTLTKIGGKNGGTLLWKNVETAYDLAYYLLTYLWQPVAEGDTYAFDTADNLKDPSNATYNRLVPERNTIRMYKDDLGNYTLDAAYAVGYSGRYILNSPAADPDIGEGNKGSLDNPFFAPIDGLGFDADGIIKNNFDTDNAALEANKYRLDAGDSNYHFTMHASGNFVYYADQNLYFEFSGDDDVYFFINGKMALDIGAGHYPMSGSVDLNKRAADLELVEGGVYTFDMFYAERAANGSNLKFSTNMQITNTAALTTKGQYLEQVGNHSMVNESTGMGAALIDNAVVNIDSTVAYSFELLNTGDVPLYNVSFNDGNLGTTISPNDIILNSSTEIGEIQVYYRRYDPETGKLYEGTPALTKYGDMVPAITSAMIPPDGETTKFYEELKLPWYRVTVTSKTELMELLRLGVPVNCQMSVYGFKRKMSASDIHYVNTLDSICYYRSDGRDVPISGSASRQLRIPTDIAQPQVEKAQYVIDYGKPISLSEEDVLNRITTDSAVTVMGFVGLTYSGNYNGELLRRLPSDLFCNDVNSSYETVNCIYTREESGFSYQIKSFLSNVETVYAVCELSGFVSNKIPYPYIVVELNIIPANIMYYEAEDFADHISYYQKTTDKSTGEVSEVKGWSATDHFKKENETSADAPQNLNWVGQEVYYPNYIGDDEVLFFGFGNTPEDQQRYQSSIYGGVNFDDPDEVNNHWFCQHWHKVERREIDTEAGTLNLISKDLPGGEVIQNDQYPDLYFDTANDAEGKVNPLQYDPSKAEVMQVRFKMKDLVIGTYYPKTSDNKYVDDPPKEYTVNPYLTLQFKGNGTDSLVSAKFLTSDSIHTDLLTGETYVTMRLRFNPEDIKKSDGSVTTSFVNYDSINRLRIFFAGMEKNPDWDPGVLTVDYVYIGPESKAPVDAAYGRDNTYDNDSHLSNGESLFVLGKGVRNEKTPNPDNYTEMRFSFTGTGFDLISCTGKNQGTIRVEVYDNPDYTGKPLYGTPVNLQGKMEMYQLPVYSRHDLPYGTYYVSVMVNDEVSMPLFSYYCGNEFYLDGIRIYNPIDVSAGSSAPAGSHSAIAYAAYCADGEAHPIVEEFRDILLTAGDFNALTGEKDGAIFVDYIQKETTAQEENNEATEPTTEPPLTLEDHVTANVTTYTKQGPNNETYLGQQQLIAFKLMIYSNELPARIDIGCKAIEPSGTNLRASIIKADGSRAALLEKTVATSAAQYYSLPLWREQFTAGVDESGKPCYYAYLKIENTSPKRADAFDENVLSITDLKIAYSQKPTPLETDSQQVAAAQNAGAKRTVSLSEDVELPMDEFEPVRFVVDGSVSDIVKELLEERFDPNCDHVGGPWNVVVQAAPGQEGLVEQCCVHCGELLKQEKVQAVTALKFAGASVTLQSDLCINYKVDSSFFTELGYTDPYVVITVNGVQTVIRNYRIQKEKYVFTYANIAPHRIGDIVTATLYASYEGSLYCSENRDYSVATYCYNMLGKYKEEQHAKLRTLLVDILHYGAKTQEYMNYRMDALCNAALTQEQLAWGTASYRELVSVQNKEFVKVENPEVLWKGAGLNLMESVAIRFKIETESFEDLVVKVECAGNTYSIPAKNFEHRPDGSCYVFFKSLDATQMSEPVYATVYRNGVQVSHTICYSIESYAYSKQTDDNPVLAELVKIMMCYGDSARAYIESTK